MSDSGSGQRNDPYERAGRDDEDYSSAPSWKSSLNSGSWEHTRPYEPPASSPTPNPFSREGSAPGGTDQSGSSDQTGPSNQPGPLNQLGRPNLPGSASSASDPPGYRPDEGGWPSYPAPPPSAAAPQSQTYSPYPQPAAPPYGAYDDQAIPPYGAGSAGYDPYQYAASAYPAAPYGVNPYQGYVGQGPQNHPQATTALVLGIISLVLCASCGIGGLLGIPAIVIGGRARKEIDADPQRYTGRSSATAGWVLGIVSVSLFALIMVLVVVAGVAGAFES